ncbi:cupin domain-containing protein [Pseudomonas sp. LTJR-52]|uniref:cupin domain-containing protein n=1 Tax=Pseudomonas sp. LTJR-52 TaxID=2479392 RepID=UPI000EFBBB8D|nr:cupin domain-containing protein [Pseudomonas sp. LTJR-52]AYN96569.1 cupin domain-containing protein [Pseudomonas sp. LTJR-52]
MSFLPIHRIVTGHDANGRSTVCSEGALPSVVEMEAIPGFVFHEVWETTGSPVEINNAADPTTGPVMHNPPPNGTRIRFVDLPPDETYFDQHEARIAELFEQVNYVDGLTVKHDSPHSMMHRSEAIDYCVVIEGEIYIVLDDAEVLLKPGSVVVQRGTNHAWSTRSNSNCRLLFVQLDGRYAPDIADRLSK